MSVTQVLTACVALYGAVVSTLVLILQARSKRWRVKASYQCGVRGEGQYIGFNARNVGERAVWITSVTVQYDQGKPRALRRFLSRLHVTRLAEFRSGFFGSHWPLEPVPIFPVELAPGQSVEVLVTRKCIEEGLKRLLLGNRAERIAGAFHDALGQTYLTPPIAVDPVTATIVGLPLPN